MVFSNAVNKAIEPDPRFATVSMWLTIRNADYTGCEIRQLDLELIDEERHSQFFGKGSLAETQAAISSDGEAKIYTIKDLGSVELINNSVRVGSQFLTA